MTDNKPISSGSINFDFFGFLFGYCGIDSPELMKWYYSNLNEKILNKKYKTSLFFDDIKNAELGMLIDMAWLNVYSKGVLVFKVFATRTYLNSYTAVYKYFSSKNYKQPPLSTPGANHFMEICIAESVYIANRGHGNTKGMLYKHKPGFDYEKEIGDRTVVAHFEVLMKFAKDNKNYFFNKEILEFEFA